MENKYTALFKNTFIFALGNLGSKLIVFLLVPLYTNYLTTEQYGTADFVFTISQLFIPVISLVIFDAVIRYGISNKEHPESTLLSAVIVWFIGSIALLFFMPTLVKYASLEEWKWYVYIYISLNVLLPIVMNYLKVKDKNLSFSIISILQTASQAGLNILLIVFLKTGVQGYILSNVLATVVATVLAIILSDFFKDLKKAKFDKELFKTMVMYSAPLIFNNLAWWIIQSSDKVMIKEFVGLAALGLYTVATRIPSLITVLVTIFQQAWGISSSIEMDSTNDTSFYSKVLDGYSFLVFLACIGLNLIVKPFMAIYVGADFIDAWYLVPLLVVSAAFSAMAAYYGSMYSALKKSVNNMLTTVIAAVINIVVNYIFIIHIGAMGAVVGTVVSYIVMAYIRMFDVLRHVNIKVNIKKFMLNSLIVIVQALLVVNNHYIYLVSIVSLFVYILINKDTLLFLKKR